MELCRSIIETSLNLSKALGSSEITPFTHARTHTYTHACMHTHTHTHILRLVLPSLHRVKIPSAKQSAEFTGQKSGNARRRSRTAVASQQNPTPYLASGPDGPLGDRKLEIYWSKWANAVFTI